MAQTERILNEIARRLREVIEAVKANAWPDYEATYTVAAFFRDCENVNAIVSAVENEIDKGVDLREEAAELITLCDEFGAMDGKGWRSADYKLLYDAHLAVWKPVIKAASEESLKLWRAYKELSNRLAWIPCGTPEYEALDKECDEAKRRADEASARTKQLHHEHEAAGRDAFCVYLFDWSFMTVLVSRLRDIAEATISAVNDMREEVQP